MSVRIQTEPFDINQETAALSDGRMDIGAVVTFTGKVRSGGMRDEISALTLEHYPGMTEAEIEAIEAEAVNRFKLLASLVVHRVGRLEPGEDIVLVIAAAKHRQAAFDGAAFMMDYLKTKAPFWKKETSLGGDAAWVETRESDGEAADRWTRPAR